MKIKPLPKTGGVLVELGLLEQQLPPSGVLPAFNLKNILVPVDFSDCSKKALQYAVPFAKQFGAELTLLYVVQLYPGGHEMMPVDFEVVDDGKRQLAAFQKAFSDAVPTKAVVRQGVPYAEIVELAGELAIDLIMLATHGRTGLTRALLGSTAEKVVRHAPCPVLIVRETEREFVPSAAPK